MSEMVERVARALEGAEIEYHLWLTRMDDSGSIYTLTYDDGETLTFDGTDTAHKHIGNKKRLKAARAAIEAMREPTEEMHKAGNGEMDEMEDGNGHAFCEHIWRAMIDEALK